MARNGTECDVVGVEHGGGAVLARGGPRARGRQLPPIGALPRTGPHEGHTTPLPRQHTPQARKESRLLLVGSFVSIFPWLTLRGAIVKVL